MGTADVRVSFLLFIPVFPHTVFLCVLSVDCFKVLV